LEKNYFFFRATFLAFFAFFAFLAIGALTVDAHMREPHP
jgi:hypothetical protein